MEREIHSHRLLEVSEYNVGIEYSRRGAMKKKLYFYIAQKNKDLHNHLRTFLIERSYDLREACLENT